jgi:hypothetical protein
LISQIASGPLAPITALTDTVCNQANIGCVVTTDGGEAGVCAFGTILNINQYKANPGMAAVRTLLKDMEKKIPKSSRLIGNMLNNPKDFVTGLVIKERLINFPFELSPNIHKVLIEDVNWSGSSDYEPEKDETREDYQFTHLLFLSSYELESSGRMTQASSSDINENPQEEYTGDAAPVESGMGHKKKRKMDKKMAASSRVFLHWEDEVFVDRALFSHSWQNSAKPTVVRAGRKYHSFNIIYALKWSDYVDLAERISSA